MQVVFEARGITNYSLLLSDPGCYVDSGSDLMTDAACSVG